jgi:hypothetical protein
MGMNIELPPEAIARLEKMARDEGKTMLQVLRENVGVARPIPDELKQARADAAEALEAANAIGRLFGKTAEGIDELRAERDQLRDELLTEARRSAMGSVLRAAAHAVDRAANYRSDLPALFESLAALGKCLDDWREAGGFL